MDTWDLNQSYEYYQSRKSTKTTKTFTINQNFVAPQWYFHEGIQKEFARKFIKEVINAEKKKTPLKHQDTSFTDNSTIVYNWSLTGQSIIKEELHEDDAKSRIRSAVYVVRTRQQGNTTVTEEVPVVRLMQKRNVQETDLDDVVK